MTFPVSASFPQHLDQSAHDVVNDRGIEVL